MHGLLQKQLPTGPRGGSRSSPSRSRVFTTKVMSVRPVTKPGRTVSHADGTMHGAMYGACVVHVWCMYGGSACGHVVDTLGAWHWVLSVLSRRFWSLSGLLGMILCMHGICTGHGQ